MILIIIIIIIIIIAQEYSKILCNIGTHYQGGRLRDGTTWEQFGHVTFVDIPDPPYWKASLSEDFVLVFSAIIQVVLIKLF